MAELRVVRSELILGGPESGKTARAESLAAAWLAQSPGHRAFYIATAQAWDDEMRERISQHRRRPAEPVPRMATMEEPLELARAIGRSGRADTLIVVDCLTLWLTARLMPSVPGDDSNGISAPADTIAGALRACAGPIVLISNEIGPDAVPPGQDARAFLDALGGLNQQAAAACERVTLMSARQALVLKGAS
ncbi:MAG: bifunctional adenosylcobinamide kinase/adenosylcobinamide-phosphate guanylyltransferase [Ramlibacter sp.]|nr:bifunctional adenosylcobinamide kinase/adenosylcobinamide-phosphate guanylyltransferase [Ramlibacter sp.]